VIGGGGRGGGGGGGIGRDQKEREKGDGRWQAEGQWEAEGQWGRRGERQPMFCRGIRRLSLREERMGRMQVGGPRAGV